MLSYWAHPHDVTSHHTSMYIRESVSCLNGNCPTYVRRCCDTCLKSLGRILVSFEKLKDQGKQEDATGQDGCRLMEQVVHLLEHTFYMYVYVSCILTYAQTKIRYVHVGHAFSYNYIQLWVAMFSCLRMPANLHVRML